MSPLRRSTLVFTTSAALVAMLGILAVYGGHIDVGLYYDDYHFMRPWSPVDLRRVWFGSWDPAGIEAIYYRPITAWLFAARFWLFGLHAAAMHGVSVLGHAACGVLVGWFLRRERVATGIALLGVWVYAVHPSLPYAQVSWLTNQMHLAESLVVLLALIVWQAVRDRPLVWWTPIALLAAIAFLIKEDGVMLLPVILALTGLRASLIGAAWPRQWLLLLLCAALIVCGLIGVRYAQLGGLGGHEVPSLAVMDTNFWKGLNATLLLWPTRSPWQAIASGMTLVALVVALGLGWLSLRGVGLRAGPSYRRLLFAAGAALAILLCVNLPAVFLPRPGPYPLVTWQALAGGIATGALVIGLGVAMWRVDRRALFLLGAGLAIVACFNLPFLFISKREQDHLLALGAVFVFVGASQAVAARIGRRVAPVWLGVALAMTTMPLALMARDQAKDFLPCAPNVLVADQESHGWWIVPDEIRSWQDLKAARCQAGLPPSRLSDLPVVSWGVYGEQQDGPSGPYRWTSDQVVLLLRRDATSVGFAMRRPGATVTQPIRATIRTAGTTTTVTMDSDTWTYATVRLRRSLLGWLRAARRVDISVDAWFVPAVLDPRSADLRRMGVQLQVVDLR